VHGRNGAGIGAMGTLGEDLSQGFESRGGLTGELQRILPARRDTGHSVRRDVDLHLKPQWICVGVCVQALGRRWASRFSSSPPSSRGSPSVRHTDIFQAQHRNTAAVTYTCTHGKAVKIFHGHAIW
jgi:hypothetical protein